MCDPPSFSDKWAYKKIRERSVFQNAGRGDVFDSQLVYIAVANLPQLHHFYFKARSDAGLGRSLAEQFFFLTERQNNVYIDCTLSFRIVLMTYLYLYVC